MSYNDIFGPPGEWYPLDVDNRISPPTNVDKTGKFLSYKSHCCRCNKGIYGTEHDPFIKVDVDWDNLQVRNNPQGQELIGGECWKIVTGNKKKSGKRKGKSFKPK